jgi:hypothetical protein
MALALAATWPSTGPPSGAPGRRLVLNLPDWLAGAVAIGALALFLAVVATALSRRRRAETGLARRSTGAAALLAALPLLAGAAAVGTWALRRPQGEGGLFGAPAPPEGAWPLPPREALHLPAADIAVTLGLATLSLAAVALALWLIRQAVGSLRGHAARRGPRHDAALLAEVASAVAAGVDDLSTRGDDPRAAVVACYQRCERAIARHQTPPQPWQTQREFVRGALHALPLPAGPVGALLAVFERARFGDDPVTVADRDAALAALGAIRAALEERIGDGSHR